MEVIYKAQGGKYFPGKKESSQIEVINRFWIQTLGSCWQCSQAASPAWAFLVASRAGL